MASTQRNAGNLIAAMKRAVGYTPDSDSHNLWRTLNDAGNALFTLHDWSWRTHWIELSLVADQDYILLPFTFATVKEAYMASGAGFTRLEFTTIGTIVELRQGTVLSQSGGTLRVWWQGWDGQKVAENRPRGRAELWPTPAASATKAIKALVTVEWSEIDEDDETAVPNVPPKFDKLLEALACAYAVQVERREDPYENAIVVTELTRLRQEEARGQQDFGQIRGGADRFMRRGRGFSDPRNFSGVSL